MQRRHEYPNRNGYDGRFKVQYLTAETEFDSLARMRRLSAGFSAMPMLIGGIVCLPTQAKTKTDPKVRFD